MPGAAEEISRFEGDALGYERAISLEWLETNGLGGYAAGSVAGPNTRRYHGLLVAALQPPVRRVVLLAKIDETIEVGGARFDLGANEYPGAVSPRGFEHLAAFERGIFPVFEFEAGGVRLRKTIAALSGENTTVVLYEIVAAPGPVVLELRPFLAGRDFHALARRRDGAWTNASENGIFAARCPALDAELFIEVPAASFVEAPDWYDRFQYREERARGFDFEEDLWTPGVFRVELLPGASLGTLASTERPTGRDAMELVARERARREALTAKLPVRDPFARRFALAADQFLVRRGRDGATVIAGYPWFADWGRDTMIALPGLCLATGRLEEARKILLELFGAVSEGMLPNRFADDGGPAEYNTVDATLWAFVAVDRYLAATGDFATVRQRILPVLEEILAWHERGTRYGIRVESDGLLAAGEPGVQLTWMDARVGDRVVTPRSGEAVEVEALWINALRILAELRRRSGDGANAAALERRAFRARERFVERFWYEEGGYLFDVVDGDARDASLRPNQLIALALPYPLLDRRRAISVLATIEEKLLTPRGLRTLSPDDPRYCPRYEGGPAQRDAAYHQGTVWPWLLGPYVAALVRWRGAAGQAAARRVLDGFAPHLDEACVGSVSEIFDGDPPHRARGAFAQAWSVAELLVATIEVAVAAAPDRDAPETSLESRRRRRLAAAG